MINMVRLLLNEVVLVVLLHQPAIITNKVHLEFILISEARILLKDLILVVFLTHLIFLNSFLGFLLLLEEVKEKDEMYMR